MYKQFEDYISLTDLQKLTKLLTTNRFYHTITRSQLKVVVEFANYAITFDKQGNFVGTTSAHMFVNKAA